MESIDTSLDNREININLSRLTGASVTELKGARQTKRCLVIPIEDAGIFEGKDGCYLTLKPFQLKAMKYDKTHILKQRLSKERYDAMTDNERRQQAILGDVRIVPHRKEGGDRQQNTGLIF